MRSLLIGSLALLTACSPITPTITTHYKLTQYSSKKLDVSPSSLTLLITQPEAVASYQSEQMLYTSKPYTLNSFSKNAWYSPPANMLYPLLIQSLQHSGYFRAVGSGAYINNADYRLDTQLIELQQNFIQKPSVLELKIKVIITRVANHHMIVSHTFNQRVTCPQNTPYGGVIAANRATLALMKAITKFTITQISQNIGDK